MIILSALNEQIISYLLDKPVPVNGHILAKHCNVSLATMRKEIASLNDYLDPFGIQILSKKSHGYFLITTNEQKADQFRHDLANGIRRNKYLKIHKFMDCYQIARELLATNTYVTMEELCDKYYCSRSTILRNINQLKRLIQPFDLHVKNSFNKGFYITGDEWNIRKYLQYQHKIFNTLPAEQKEKEAHYADLFLARVLDYDVVRTSVMATLSQYPNINFPYIYIFKFVNCILLNHTRRRYSDNIAFTDVQIRLTKNSTAYAIAKTIYADLPYGLNENADDKDILILSAYLLSYQSMKDKRLIPADVFVNLYSFCDKMINELFADFLVQNEHRAEYIEKFTLFLFTFNNRLLFNLSIDEEIVEYIKHDGVFTTDLCVRFALYYQAHFNQIKLKEADILSPYYLIHQIRVSARWLIKQRFLIISMYGSEYARAVGHYIKRTYRHNIEKIDAVELSELPAIDIKDYDALLTDIDNFRHLLSGIGTLPIIPIQFKRNFVNDPMIERYLDNVKIDKIRKTMTRHLVVKEPDITKKSDVYHYFARLFSGEIKENGEFIDDLKQRDDFINGERSNKIVLLTTLSRQFEKPAVIVLITNKPILWNTEFSQIFIYYNYGCSPYESTYAISNVIRYFLDCTVEQIDYLMEMERNAQDLLEIISCK